MHFPVHNLSALIDFECAARLLSIKHAAKELNKTPSAVSQQIKLLEQQLGFALFERRTRQIHLTEKGKELVIVARQSLEDLKQKISELQEDDRSNRLVVSCIHSFAMKWLVKRIGQFTAQYPDIDVQIDSSNKLANLNHDTDIAIRYAPLERGKAHPMLLREELIVVHGRQLSETPIGLEDLCQHPLIYENSKANWLHWLQLNGLAQQNHHLSQSYGNAGLLVQAAVAGAGVALVPKTIAYDDIEAGNLLIVDGQRLMSSYGYFFMTGPLSQGLDKVQHFQDWIAIELGKMV